jgi:hypothetical protein
MMWVLALCLYYKIGTVYSGMLQNLHIADVKKSAAFGEEKKN